MSATPRCEYVPLQAVADRLPGRGGPPHAATIRRWIRDGVKRPDGTIIKLQATRFGSGWHVRSDAVDVFLAAMAGEEPR